MSNSIDDPSRRDFLKFGTMTAVGMNISQRDAAPSNVHTASVIGMQFSPKDPKIGIIGVGGRGTSLLQNLLAADAQVLAICDIVKEKAAHAQSLVTKAGKPFPETYANGDHAFESLVAREDLDLVIIATPWNWHVEMAVAGLKHGKHVAVEVPAATSIEDSWKLVDTS